MKEERRKKELLEQHKRILDEIQELRDQGNRPTRLHIVMLTKCISELAEYGIDAVAQAAM